MTTLHSNMCNVGVEGCLFLSQISYLPVAVSGNVFLAAYSDKIVESRFFPFYNLLHERLSRDVVYLSAAWRKRSIPTH